MARIPEAGIINTKQYTWLLFIAITSFATFQAPGLLIFQAGRDAWLSVLAAWLLDILLAVVYAYMGIRFPGENPVQYSRSILGNTLGKLVGLLFILFFLLVGAGLMRDLSIYVCTIFLPRTPKEVVLLSGYIIVAYIVRKGIEVAARMSEILGPLFLTSMIVLFILTLPLSNFLRLKPQLDHGIYPFLSGTPLILSYIGICISMGWYSAICNRPENGFLAKFSAASLGILMVCMVILFCIGSFGAAQAGNMVNPGLQLIQMIHISDYFERMETIWLMIIIGAGIITAVNAVWIFSLGVAQITGLDTYKPLIYPAALISFLLSTLSFPDNTTYLNFTFYSYPIIGIAVEFGLELLLFLSALITGRRGGCKG